MKRFQFFVFTGFLALSIAADAHQVILDPTQDATVISYSPDTNYGGVDTLWIGHDNGGWMDPMIQFDLSSYLGVIVESAYLRLYVYSSEGTFPPTDIFFERVTGSWDEMTVTWNNFPVTGDPIYIGGPASVDSWWVIDVAGMVNDWVSGTYDNYGFLLGTFDADDDWFTIRSREYSNPDYRPQLELNYHDVSVQPTSLGVLKAIYK